MVEIVGKVTNEVIDTVGEFTYELKLDGRSIESLFRQYEGRKIKVLIEDLDMIAEEKVKVVDMHDDFTCACGNTSFSDGFFSSDVHGKQIESDSNWHGHMVCARCDQVYWLKDKK